MRLSSLADYAVVLMTAAAGHCGARGLIDGPKARQNARQLSEETGIKLPTAQKLLQALARADLIETVRGAGGGIRLARPPATITLAQIVEAVDGPIAITNCIETRGHVCAIEQGCSVKPHWFVVNNAIRDALDAVSLADLTRKPAAQMPLDSTMKTQNNAPNMMEKA
ncbi:SUF system Fe-S cluster assembly regulator [Parasphingorhabdus sp. DH2-15]|jgi:FeS assembly SUF system regulator|uniref:SUF system Fe-S cluster assembly regulator n=1 Tax=Parasphingorhabdus sp. DH2-15 TaxID=3444112 RepID=UPI003F6834EE